MKVWCMSLHHVDRYLAFKRLGGYLKNLVLVLNNVCLSKVNAKIPSVQNFDYWSCFKGLSFIPSSNIFTHEILCACC